VPGETLSILEVLSRTERYLGQAGIESARLDAEVLLAHLLGSSRIQLYTRYDRPMRADELDAYRRLVRRRADREPVAYLTGVKEFHSLPFSVTPDVLIPRPETEHLVDAAVELSRSRDGPRLLDVGTGSGCIAVAWAVEVESGRFTATDRSEAALEVARGNAERHGVRERGEFRVGDLFAPAAEGAPYDLVVCNPPYVSPDEETDPECLREPRDAVFTEGDPMDLYGRLLAEAPSMLVPGGHFLLELPGARAEEIAALAPPPLEVARVVKDYHALPRVLVTTMTTSGSDPK
jgi:release factor glutamine methyltransferase